MLCFRNVTFHAVMPTRSSVPSLLLNTMPMLVIALPSLIHRIGGDKARELKTVASEYQCELKRIRRSRNWQLTGSPEQLAKVQAWCQHHDNDAFAFVLKKLVPTLNQHQHWLEPLSERLCKVLRANPQMTLAELMSLTDCSLVEAREARAAVEEEE
ncbi:ribosome recycling factor family protein [Vibrio tritonius]|uniref:ribosome recycling factor family protein n=1 Tax=Vibrio tritonius TaxID=1435069 RepID=UPI00315DDF62